MPKRRNRVKRAHRRFRSELDWFAEDPWAEPAPPTEDEVTDEWEGNEELWSTGDDGWDPIRPRRQTHE
ncbi:MAG: hypothetical protein WBG86_10530 [Polyangiales bacterium]